jgi:predicted nicotinamide N-methyase
MIMCGDPLSEKPSFLQTPREALGPIVREHVLIDGRTFVIDRPEESDRLLQHPTISAAIAADEYLPYWTELWPAARMLAKVILRESCPSGGEVLEVGCGLGLPGIAALARGCQVILSDCDLTALEFAGHNALANGFDRFRVLPLDWRRPPEDLKVPMILGSDLVYELRNINPVVALIQKMLIPGGTCLLTDQDRLPSYNLREALDGEGMKYTTGVVHAGSARSRRAKGTLYRITATR